MLRTNPCSLGYGEMRANVASDSMKPLFSQGLVLLKTEKENFFPCIFVYFPSSYTQELSNLSAFLSKNDLNESKLLCPQQK